MVNITELVENGGDITAYFVENDFNNLSHEEKIFVKNLNRPCPSLDNLVNSTKGSNRKFNLNWYEKCNWLTGSEIKNKLFCWPCLLFSRNNKSPWNSTGTDNLKNLYKMIEKHNISKEHTFATLKLKLFGKQNIQTGIDSAYQANIDKFNEKVKENRDLLKRLIDMTLFLGIQEFAFRGHNESSVSQNKGNFKELAEFLSSYDQKFADFLKTSSVFSGLSKTIQNDLIESVNFVVKKIIDCEIQTTTCFSWQVDETTDVSCFSQLSVIFRYVHKGKVVERFMGFFDVSSGRTANSLFELLIHQFDKFGLKDKLIGQTYDGASVMSGEFNGLQAKVKSIAPYALFTHCFAHRLNLILQDAVGNIQECKVFFATLCGFSSFFSKSTKRTNILDNIASSRLPTASQTRWNFKSRLITTVLKNREVLIEVFDHIINNEEFSNDRITIREAVGFRDFLNNFNNVFLLKVFYLVFEQTDMVYNVIQNKISNISYCTERIQNLVQTIISYRNDEKYFSDIYDETVILLGIPPKRRKVTLSVSQDDVSLPYKKIYNEIFDILRTQIEIRFKDLEKLSFCSLLDKTKFVSYHRKFPTEIFNTLIQTYKNFFDLEKLENELRVVYSDPSFLGNSENLLDYLSFIEENSLHDDIPQIYKLLCLILSLPATSASVERSFSTLKRIKSYARNTISQNRLNNLSVIAIEKGFIKSVKDSSFFDRIIDHFASVKDRRIDLIYKKP